MYKLYLHYIESAIRNGMRNSARATQELIEIISDRMFLTHRFSARQEYRLFKDLLALKTFNRVLNYLHNHLKTLLLFVFTLSYFSKLVIYVTNFRLLFDLI